LLVGKEEGFSLLGKGKPRSKRSFLKKIGGEVSPIPQSEKWKKRVNGRGRFFFQKKEREGDDSP